MVQNMIAKQRQENTTSFDEVLASHVSLEENRNFLKLYTVRVFNVMKTKKFSLSVNT